MNIMEGIYKFMNFINENWTMLCAIIVIGIAVYGNVKRFFSKSREEQIKIAKEHVKEIMLRLVMEAECDYREWIKAGAIKRVQVIDCVFEKYPILLKVTNRDELIAWLDEAIDKALDTMRKIFEENEKQKASARHSKKKSQAKEMAEG